MKPPKLAVCLAAAVALYAFATSNAHAVASVFATTNVVTINAMSFPQGSATTNGNAITYAVGKSSSHNTAEFIGELGSATTNTFSPAAKLVLINGFGTNLFAVIDGTKSVDVSTIVSINPISDARTISGTQKDFFLSSPTVKESQIIAFNFDDSALRTTNALVVRLQGLGSATITDTTPNTNGVFTETFNGKITSMTGEGSSKGQPFLATGSVSISGKGQLSE